MNWSAIRIGILAPLVGGVLGVSAGVIAGSPVLGAAITAAITFAIVILARGARDSHHES